MRQHHRHGHEVLLGFKLAMASPLYYSNLLLQWFGVALGHRSSRYCRFNHYHHCCARMRHRTECARHGRELKLVVAGID